MWNWFYTWAQGPKPDSAIFWLGYQIFWWKRLSILLQFIGGSLILLNLLKESRREAIHSKITKIKDYVGSQPNVDVEKMGRNLVKNTLKTIGYISLIISMMIAIFSTFDAHGEIMPLVGLVLVTLFLVSLVAFPIFFLILNLMLVYVSYKRLQKFVPVLLAWFFIPEKLERNVVLLSWLLFFFATALQVFLS